MTGDSAPSLLARAIELHRQGRLEQASKQYRRILREQPRETQALRNLGTILLQQGDHRQAATLLGQAVTAGAQDPVTRYNYALALQELGDLDAAVAGYERVLALDPRLLQAHYNRANALLAAGRHAEAVAGYDAALGVQPGYADAWRNRGDALLALRQWAAAGNSFEQAVALKPELAGAHAGLGAALLSQRRYAAAAASLRTATALAPSDPQALCNLGTALLELGEHAAASPLYARALELSPAYPFLEGQLLLTKLRLSDWSDFDLHCTRIRAGLASGKQVTPPFPVFAFEDSTEAQCTAARLWAQAWFPPDDSLGPVENHAPDKRIRIGYFSADFHEHATMYLMAGLFELHDRERFELYAFSFGPETADGMRERVSRCFTRFIDARSMTDRDVARLARGIGIDIAIDLKGYTTDARPGIFACRAAPLQVAYLGYPGSVGAEYVDYLIADRTVIPDAEEQHYREQVVYLPDCYQVNDHTRTIADKSFSREELGLPARAVVLCAFNNNYKITPAMFDVWCRILGAAPDSCLWLLVGNAQAEANLQREALARGVDSARLVFAPRMPLADHLARLRAADLFLDTFPCNAHTTASDALRAGLPLLTLAGDSFASRVAASLLQAAGLPELITTSLQAYEQRALTLAADPERLQALRTQLVAKREQSSLFDTPRFVRGFESALQEIHAHRMAGASLPEMPL